MLAVTLPASAGETANARQVAKEARRARRSFMFFPPVRPLRGAFSGGGEAAPSRLPLARSSARVARRPAPGRGICGGCRSFTDQGPRLSAAPGETVDVMVLTSLDLSPHDAVRVLLGDQRQPLITRNQARRVPR